MNAVDAVMKDHSKGLKEKLLRSLLNVDDVSKTENMMQKLTLAVGMKFLMIGHQYLKFNELFC